MTGPVLLFFSMQLTSADISVDLSAGAVVASYRLATGTDSIEFTAARTAELSNFEVTGGMLISTRGLYRFTVPGSDADGEIGLSYTVPIGFDRVPIFVPDVPTEASRGAVVIRITGVPGDARVSDGFPRMQRLADGTIEARPANVPSFLILPPAAGGVGVNQIADWFVVFMLLSATGFWFWWRRK